MNQTNCLPPNFLIEIEARRKATRKAIAKSGISACNSTKSFEIVANLVPQSICAPTAINAFCTNRLEVMDAASAETQAEPIHTSKTLRNFFKACYPTFATIDYFSIFLKRRVIRLDSPIAVIFFFNFSSLRLPKKVGGSLQTISPSLA